MLAAWPRSGECVMLLRGAGHGEKRATVELKRQKGLNALSFNVRRCGDAR